MALSKKRRKRRRQGVLVLAGCGKSGAAKFSAGTYTGVAQGYGGEVSVTITTNASKILSVTAAGNDETPSIGGRGTLQRGHGAL